MSADLAPVRAVAAVTSWRLRGRARIDDRPAVHGQLEIRADGTWAAEVATFTLAGQVDLLFESAEGGRFCGPSSVESSRASTGTSSGIGTSLRGCGPLLVVAEDEPGLESPDAEMVDGEVVDS